MTEAQCWKCNASSQMETFCTNCYDDGYPTPLILGKYKVIRRLGAGAFGIVYECLDPAIDRSVAIKKLFPNTRGVAGELSRIRSSGRLSSPHIVQTFDVNTDDGHIVMEYVAGGTLLDKMRTDIDWIRAHFPQLMLDICEALRVAHSEQIIHRDIKPENILLTLDGRAKVGDFGICAALESADFTRTIAGTPPYMAPEVLEGNEYSFEADIHSLGCVMYLIWADRLPWAARGDVMAYLASKTNQIPEPLARAATIEVSELLSDLVERMLATGPRRIKAVDVVEQQLASLLPRQKNFVPNIDDMFAQLLVIYGYANTGKAPVELLNHYQISVTEIASALFEGRQARVERMFVRGFSWLCAFLASINLRPSQLINLKYRGSCPYCELVPCDCGLEVYAHEAEKNSALLERIRPRWPEEPKAAETFREYQLRFRRIFGGRNAAEGPHKTILHAYAEVSEALDAWMHLDPDNLDTLLVLHLEASDLIAWFFAMLNNNTVDFDFSAKFLELYSEGCYTCRQRQCICPAPIGLMGWRDALRLAPATGKES